MLQKTPSYNEITSSISVTVEPEYMADRSSPEDNVYLFGYTVTIENLGNEVAQLINRHWVVNSGDRQFADIKGEGVVGEQPSIEPQTGYQYGSWTVIDRPTGSMQGVYTFRSEIGKFFDVLIPRFELQYLDPARFH